MWRIVNYVSTWERNSRYCKSDRNRIVDNPSLIHCNSLKPSTWVRLFTKIPSSNILPKKALLRVHLPHYYFSAPLHMLSAPPASFRALHWIN